MLNFSFAFLATIIHIAGAYFRYLPFAEAIDHKGTVKLWRALLLWSIPGLLMNFLVVHTLLSCCLNLCLFNFSHKNP